MKKKYKSGISLIEILITVSIFGIVGILTTRSLFSTLRGAKKSDSTVKVRENINLAFSVIERQIRNAQSINCQDSTSTVLNYTSLEGVSASFSCIDTYLASGSARLTSTEIDLTNCNFVCTQNTLNEPPIIKISLTAFDNLTTSVEKSTISSEMEIIARNY